MGKSCGLEEVLRRIEAGTFTQEDALQLAERCREYRDRIALWCAESVQQVQELHALRRSFADLCTRSVSLEHERDALEARVKHLEQKNTTVQQELDYTRLLLHTMEMDQGREHVRR